MWLVCIQIEMLFQSNVSLILLAGVLASHTDTHKHNDGNRHIAEELQLIFHNK